MTRTLKLLNMKDVPTMTSFKKMALMVGISVAGVSMTSAAMAQTFGGEDTREPYWQSKPAKAKADADKKKAEEEVTAQSYIVVDQRARDGYTKIQDAIDDVAWGGVVVVLPGDYRENITLTKPVSLQGNQGPAPIRIMPTDASRPCLEYNPYRDSDHALISNIQFDTTLMSDTGTLSTLKIKNGARRSSAPSCVSVKSGVFTMKESVVDGGGYHNGAMVSITGGMAVLEKNTIKGGAQGIMVHQTHALWDRAMLVDNIVTDNNTVGIHLDGISSTLATGNLIKNNGNGLTYNGQGETKLVGNKILNNRLNGVVLQENAKQVLMRLNQIWSNNGHGIEVGNNQSNGLIEYNDFNGNTAEKIHLVRPGANDLRFENNLTIDKRRFFDR